MGGSSQRQKATSESIYRMQSVLSKDSGQTIAFGDLSSSPWFSTKQLQLSLSKCGAGAELETTPEHCYDHAKQSDSLYQEHDSSSSLSSGQAHHEGPTLARSNSNMQNISFQPGMFDTHAKKGEACTKPYLSWGNEDFVNNQLQGQHMPPLACNSNPFAEQYIGGIITAYGPNAVVYPKLVGITPARVVLPLDYTEGIPVYVNAKQYHAILRRRQIRAKLEVHNKIAKARKPYLHESRHRHALKRARGSGGRFLNTKNTHDTKPPTQMYAKDLSLKHMGGNGSEPEIQHSGSNSWGTSTQSSSDVSCIFNNEDVYGQHDFRASFGTVHNGTRARVLAPDESVLLSVDRYARISTAM